MNRHNTKFTLTPGHFEASAYRGALPESDGLVPLSAVIDFTVGDEVALYWRDSTSFITELSSIHPFQLHLRVGLFRSDFGPLMWMLFFVPNPRTSPQPFASMECHLNPHSPSQLALWRRLANQTHWHLSLVDGKSKIINFFEFENVYGLDTALDSVERVCTGMPVTDFMRAKQHFWDTYSMDDLYSMK
jgi:hypothetical protein